MALSPAEKQRRYRERLKTGVRPVRYRKPQDRRSRAQRWRDAVAELLELRDPLRPVPRQPPRGPAGHRVRRTPAGNRRSRHRGS